ncbi:hypothetical protein GC173_04540 [bacterium]|nr:hypothetical protein [bacterium]
MTLIPQPPPDAPLPVRLLKACGGFGKPSIWIVDLEGTPRVWKTWACRPSWERRTLGRRLAQHEGKVIKALSGLEGFPTLLGHPHPWTIEMTLLDAEPVPEIKHGEALSPLYFERLWEALEAMHARGINHGDLRRKNLLRAPGDPHTPRLVDFTQSLYFPPPQSFPKSWILNEAIRIDRVTFLKLKRWYAGPESLTQIEIGEALCIPWHLRVGRFLRQSLYRPVRRALQKKAPR